MVVKRVQKGLMLALILALVAITGSARADAPAVMPGVTGIADDPAPQGATVAVAPLLQYQGRLTDPTSGEPVADGVYEMSFRLYDVESGGTPLWQETKDVPVQGGIFATALGDTTGLDHGLFNGQGLWLGIKVGADPEATPRMPMLPVAYALSLAPGAVIATNSVDPALHVNNAGSGDGLAVDGSATVTGNLNVGGSLVGGAHEHDGEAITTGIVNRARIDSLIARDSEIVPTMLANDGAGSTLDADLLDGRSSEDYANADHEHSGGDITSGTVPQARIDSLIARDSEIVPTMLANDGAGSTLDADLLDGMSSEDFADAAHNHDARYYLKTQIENNFVNNVGPEAMSANHTDPVLSVNQEGGGVAGYFFAGSDHGLVGETTGAGAGQAGVLGESTGTGSYQTGVLGVTSGAGTGQTGVRGIAGDTDYATGADAGIFGESTGGFGVLGHSDSYFGVYGHSETGTGVRGDGYGTPAAVSGYNYGTGYGGYFYASSGTALRANGDALVSGDLTVDRVAYAAPRTHYYSVGGEAFQPRNDVAFASGGGMGGAYITSGSGSMVAAVHLPHGAVVTSFEVFYYDASNTDNMAVTLYGLELNDGPYYQYARIETSGYPGYSTLTDTTIGYDGIIDNMVYGYNITVFSSSWSSDLKIMGAVIAYTIDEAP